MKRWSIPTIALVLFGPLAFAQQQPAQDNHLLSSDLVLWSYMQEPRQPEPGQMRQTPTPDPRPETQPQPNPPGSQPQGSSAGAPAAQTFMGTISKEGDNFVLQVSRTVSYKLDNQQQVQQYQGRRVRVTGTLDSSANLIHVDKIEPLS